MSLFSSLLTRVRSYVGPRPLPTGTSFEDGMQRQTMPQPNSTTRWFLADLETAIIAADQGNLQIAGRLWRALRCDGTISGVLSTRTDGLVQLPMRFTGKLADELAKDFRNVFPSSELSMLSADGRGLVGVAEFVQIKGSLPVLRRLDPEFLVYRWSEDRWYYRGIHGLEPVNPGDGRWVLHCPGGAVTPWAHGLCFPLSRPYIAKEHAYHMRENYSSKLANAARVAVSPQGTSEAIKEGWFKKVAAWGVNTVFDVPPGFDVKLLESKGEGHKVFQDIIEASNEEITITIAGQTVTTDGGAGFQNSDIHKTIRSDLIQADADALSATLQAQALPVWANERFGAAAAEEPLWAGWDVSPPKDLNAEAMAATAAAASVKAWNELLAPMGKRVDVEAAARKYGVQVVEIEKAMRNAPLAAVPRAKEAA